jgi:NAD(P)-dependent dehydrogenase (short-subunit alcohol dehydrogenase family)
MSNPLAIVTGGSRGLGFETARGLAKSGFDLVLISKEQARLNHAREVIAEEFPQSDIFTSAIDLEASTAEGLAQIQLRFQEIMAEHLPRFGDPKVLVLAHGVMSAKMSKTLKTDVSEWRRVLSINLDSVFAIVNQVAPVMADAREGRIIIYSACLGRMSGPGNVGGLTPYRISKSGINALVRNLAHETGNGTRGFLVDAICPNHSRTDMGGADAPRSAEEGAETAIWLATRPFTPSVDQTGLLWEDREIVPW